MAKDFNVISKQFLNQYINGDTFALNLGVFATRLVGNVGDKIKLIEKIEVSITVNPNEAVRMQYTATADPTFGILKTDSINFQTEGLFEGANVDVILDGITVPNVVLGAISGNNNNTLNITKAALISNGIVDGETRSDIVIKLKTAPNYLNYKYGLNEISTNYPNYLSPMDNNEQSYYLFTIPASPTFGTMQWIGNQIGSDMSDSVKVTFNGTTAYDHAFTIEHIFIIPWYLEGEQVNVETECVPLRFSANNTLKYGNGFFFGGTTNETIAIFEDLGGTTKGAGNVGYLGQNFNGGVNEYTAEDLVITNSLDTGTIEATVVNNVAFTMRSSDPTAFAGGETIIIQYAKQPTSNEYANQKEAFSDVWTFENLRQIEGAGAVSGTIITNLLIVLVGQDMNVTFDVQFTAAEQLKMDNSTDFILTGDIATKNLGKADTVDKVKVVISSKKGGKEPSLGGLVTAWRPDIFEHWDFKSGTKFFSNFDGWDGDLIGMRFSFLTDTTKNSLITIMRLFVEMDTGTFKNRLAIPTSFPSIQLHEISDGTYNHQLFDSTIDSPLSVPDTDALGFINLTALQPTLPATATQFWSGSIGVRIPWQEWIENLIVPNSFVDYAEPHDNKNQKSSNYSGISGYTIKLMLSINIRTNVNGVVTDTPYALLSDSSSIADFDTNGGTFVATTKLYDISGDVTSDIFSNSSVRIEIEFVHALGVLPVGDIWGRIWIEQKEATGEPWDLSTDKDFTNPLNPLVPSDTLATGNVQFVEIVSINNLVTLICFTEPDNLIEGEYNIYGRLGNKL